jgi:outer membrane murein-binding lipoprotein Lpp
MKKLVFFAVIVAAVAFSSCSKKAATEEVAAPIEVVATPEEEVLPLEEATTPTEEAAPAETPAQ